MKKIVAAFVEFFGSLLGVPSVINRSLHGPDLNDKNVPSGNTFTRKGPAYSPGGASVKTLPDVLSLVQQLSIPERRELLKWLQQDLIARGRPRPNVDSDWVRERLAASDELGPDDYTSSPLPPSPQ